MRDRQRCVGAISAEDIHSTRDENMQKEHMISIYTHKKVTALAKTFSFELQASL
jgi:hypothetical protein